MFRTFDIILIVIMTAAATVTYSIKHNAEGVLDNVKKLDSEIKLEQDTIDLLKADWALATQPNRLANLVTTFQSALQLQPTDSTQIVRPNELPMMKADLDALEAAKEVTKPVSPSKTDNLKTGSVKR